MKWFHALRYRSIVKNVRFFAVGLSPRCSLTIYFTKTHYYLQQIGNILILKCMLILYHLPTCKAVDILILIFSLPLQSEKFIPKYSDLPRGAKYELQMSGVLCGHREVHLLLVRNVWQFWKDYFCHWSISYIVRLLSDYNVRKEIFVFLRLSSV